MVDIRDERADDIAAVREVHREAFGQEVEGKIVDALRGRGAVLASLVAVVDRAVVGHILFSPVTCGTVTGAGLAPLAVRPLHQRRGLGSQLVERGLERLRTAGCPFVVVVGHPEFYPRFGFRPAGARGLRCRWDVPSDVFMVNVLRPEAGTRLSGLVDYQPEFDAVE